jgi:hypothetical protein
MQQRPLEGEEKHNKEELNTSILWNPDPIQ